MAFISTKPRTISFQKTVSLIIIMVLESFQAMVKIHQIISLVETISFIMNMVFMSKVRIITFAIITYLRIIMVFP